MSPECLYWVTLCALVLPSLPFNKMALVVLAVWAFGHLCHTLGPFEDAAYMFSRIVALGAAVAISHPWNGHRRVIGHAIVAWLFIPSALLAAYAAIYFEHPPADMAEWRHQATVYWINWAIIMAQAIAIPFSNDWSKLKKFDEWIMGRIIRHFGGAA